MDTLHVLICIIAGWIPSLFMAGVILKPFTGEDRSVKSVILCFSCIAVLAAAGSLLYVYWKLNAIGFVIGVLLTFMPYFRTSADIEEENAKEEKKA